MYLSLGQAINYLNPQTVTKFMVTAKQPLPEIDLARGKSKTFDRYELTGDVLNHEVLLIDCVNDMINFKVE